jgi:predicted transcriptional regulator
MISGAQIKAARMLLNWDVSTLARSASVQEATIIALEAGSDEPASDEPFEARTLIKETLEAAGVTFPDNETVRLKQPR